MKNNYETYRIEQSKKFKNNFFRWTLLSFTTLALLFVTIVILFILSFGMAGFFKFSELSFSNFLFGNHYDGTTSFAAGFMIINTLWVAFLAIVIALPISLFTAIFITRTASPFFKKFLIVVIAILAAVPSVIYGAFGAKLIDDVFITVFGSISGSLLTIVVTLAIMIMPTITLITIGSINAVNKDLENSSLALGATKQQTSFFVTLKAAQKGILAATILGVGRALGEATAVSMISSSPYFGPSFGFFEPIRLLTSTMLNGFGETATGSVERASMYAMAMLLMFTIIVVFLALKFVQSIFDEENKAQKATNKILRQKEIYHRVGKYGEQSLSTEQLIYHQKMVKHDRFEKLRRIQSDLRYKQAQELEVKAVSFDYEREKNFKSNLLKYATYFFSALGVLFLVGIILFLFIGGFQNLTWSYVSTIGPDGLAVAIYGTILMIILTMLFAIPTGISGGIYFALFSHKNRFTHLLSLSIDMLAGIPSLIFGLVGFALFYPIFGPGALGMAPLAGAITMTFIVLPTIIKTTQEAIETVPTNQINSSLGLGASKMNSALYVAIPQSLNQIISGLILSIGRIIGESAALVMIFGLTSQNSLAAWTINGGTTLSTEIYALTKAEIIDWNLIKTIGIIIMIIIFFLALISQFISARKWFESSVLAIGFVILLLTIFIGQIFGLVLFILTLIIMFGLVIAKHYDLFNKFNYRNFAEIEEIN